MMLAGLGLLGEGKAACQGGGCGVSVIFSGGGGL